MIAISTLVKFGMKKVVHVIATSSKELQDVSDYVGNGWGIRCAGTPNEHLTLTPSQVRILQEKYQVEQLEQDIKYYKDGEI